MDCAAAADGVKGMATFILLVGLAAGIWAMVDIGLENKITKLKTQRDRGVYFCPLHKCDRVDCEEKHSG